jgi:hypothetical protein
MNLHASLDLKFEISNFKLPWLAGGSWSVGRSKWNKLLSMNLPSLSGTPLRMKQPKSAAWGHAAYKMN